MGDSTLYDTTVPSQGSVGLAHQKILRLKVAGVWVNITGDLNNLNLNPTKITVPREVYGNKARPANEIIGYSFAPTFAIELVRDPVTGMAVAAQSWLPDLVKDSFRSGSENMREFQIIDDALDERFPAFEGTFSVATAPLATNFSDKGGYSFTLESQGVVAMLEENPIAGTGAPIIESAGPALQGVGEQVVIRGYNLRGVTGITVDGEDVVEFSRPEDGLDDNTLVVTIPEDVTGAAAIVVTNAVGASEPFDYTAATA